MRTDWNPTPHYFNCRNRDGLLIAFPYFSADFYAVFLQDITLDGRWKNRSGTSTAGVVTRVRLPLKNNADSALDVSHKLHRAWRSCSL